ncbi:MAG TPA: LysR family transcriptional regulator, partial [Firmicutes bacterium]|nr:LysR family transcriptional regulator [Bacillota bacterium]
KLYISQSAVSQSVRLLENKLNCTLFNRTTKQVRLTAEGEVLFRHIEQAYNFIKGGERS